MAEDFSNIIKIILKSNHLDINGDIIRGNGTLSYDRYIDIYKLEKVNDNIKSFNNNFISLGGRVYKKDDKIANYLELTDSFYNYNPNYIYVIPSYLKDFTLFTTIVKTKFSKLKENKDLLVIASPIRMNALDNNKVLTYLANLSTPIYHKIYLVNLDKIHVYDISNNSYQLIKF